MESSDPGQADVATALQVIVSNTGRFISNIRKKAEETSDRESYLGPLTRIGMTLSTQFMNSGQIADIDAAIACQGLVIEWTPDAHPDKGPYLGNLGNSYQRRFDHSAEITDSDKGFEYLSQGVAIAPDTHPHKPAMLNNLGVAYFNRYDLLGERLDFENGLVYLGQAESLLPDSHQSKPEILNSIACLYEARFGRQSNSEDISQSIQYLNKAVLLVSDDQEFLTRLLIRLAALHRIQCEYLNDVDVLEKALDYINRAISLAPIGNTQRPEALTTLASIYYARFERIGEHSDIDNTINYITQAISLTPDDHRRKLQGRLENLGKSYHARFRHTGDLSDLENAIDSQNRAHLLAPDRHSSNITALESLGGLYWSRFVRLGEVEDIDKAINYHRQAVALTPDGHLHRSSVLSSCGSSHCTRFQHLGDISDIDLAVDYLTQAVSLIPETDAFKPRVLNGLGLAYHSRYNTLGNLSDIDNAIDCLNQAVSLTPDGHVEMPRALGNLGVSYTTRFRNWDDRSDISQAIDCLSKSVMLTSDSHSYKPERLSALGEAYRLRFERSSDPQDNKKAIECHLKAFSLIPEGHVNQAETLVGLGMSCVDSVEHLHLVAPCFRQAAQCQTGDPGTRFMAARRWATMDFLGTGSQQLAYKRIMELLPQLVWLGTTIEQRYKRIEDLGTVATEAASFAISCGNFEQAVEWLEEARSIVWNQILQLRTPLEELALANPELANRLEAIGRELEHAGARSTVTSLRVDGPLNLQQDAEHHRHLASEWNKLLNQARSIPGFHDFMRPRTGKDFLSVAKNGPVVIINVHSSRCDALIVLPNSDEIAHVPLDSFSFDKAVNARVELTSLLGNRGGRAGGFKRFDPTPDPEKNFRGMLAVLWLDVVKPICDFLSYTHKLGGDELPRITWCTTGPLSFLPLHAAGCYDGVQPNVFDLVVSSYTPTLSALLAPTSRILGSHTGILAVGQEHTEGLGDLPNTVSELAAIKEHTKLMRYLQLDGNNATVDSVLGAMGEYSWVHLACHATQSKEDPGQSAFHLCDGDLALATITKQSFGNKGLAFLSACQTAAGDDKLPDESVHLAAGMLMAGYPSVIATMWSINDEDAPEVAERIYGDLLKYREMDHGKAARALHGAVAALREKVGEQVGEEWFRRWVPFIHIGL